MKQFTLKVSKRLAFETVLKVAEELDWEVEEKSLSKGTIQLYYDGDLLSFGNKIDITIDILSESKTSLQIEARSAAQVQLIDWGTNDRLEDKQEDAIKNLMN
ncbi:MAG: DUF1499 domain-containing protein [Bacteroidota bacterium]